MILSLRRYEGDRQTFAELLDHCDGDLARSIEMVRTLGWNKLPKKARSSITPFRLLSERIASGDCPGSSSTVGSEVAIEEGDALHPVADRPDAPVIGADGVRIESGRPG